GEGVSTVLDVCCGTGLMATELLPLGYSVVGTDASEAMLARARELLGKQVELLNATLPELGTSQIFDAAISTFDGLNYLTPESFDMSLSAIAKRVRPGGWLCFDLHTDAMMDFTLKNAQISGEEQGQFFTIRSDVDPVLRTCNTYIEVTDTNTGGQFTEHHQQYFHTDDSVRLALTMAGFTDVVAVEEYSSAPATADTLRATWIARKKKLGMPAQ
ncbi:MAG: class I SAM-dependent methyltransferase, partial [Actinomycetota bacterium]|nr:class I SAM-dependent methyltransferase [Actinomycetota bacterium]